MNRDFADLAGFHEFAKRAARTDKRLADGSLGGATNLASPVAQPPVVNQPRIVESLVSAGGIASWMALRVSLSQPAIPAGGVGSLLWRDQGLAGMIVGSAFSFSSGAPGNIVVEEASFVQVNLYVSLNSANETFVAARVAGLDWGSIEDVKAATLAYGQTMVHFSFHSVVGAGDIITATAWHDDVDDNLSVFDSAISVLQLARL